MTAQPWGRLLIAGGTDFAQLGRKDKSGKTLQNPERPDLPQAHIFRTVANIKFKRVFTSHSGCHAVAISADDRAYLLGRNDHHQLSWPLPSYLTSSHNIHDGSASATPAVSHPFPLDHLPEENAPKALKEQGIVYAACGRSHTILVTDQGEAWAAGYNTFGQCGQTNEKKKGSDQTNSTHEHVSRFMRVRGELLKEKVVAASAGNSFSLFLCESGRVYAVGSGEHGCLGDGRTGERIATSKTFYTEQTEPLLIRGGLEGKKIIQITSGQQHSVALDDEGYCYAWGFGGFGRLGTGVQADQLFPTLIPTFAGTNVLTRCSKIAAGGTNTMFIDRQQMVWLCGRFKISGDGSSGQPWMTPKIVQDLMGYKFELISAGGVTLFAATHDPKEGDFTCCWGQSALYGELALGPSASKSATKPQRIELLNGISMLDLAAGQNTTYFIARPPATETELAVAAKEEEVRSAGGSTATTLPGSSAPEAPASASESKASAGFDISSFGFGFGAPASNSAAPTPPPIEAKSEQVKPSTTIEEQWNALPRYPELAQDPIDECKLCGQSGDDALECEMCQGAFHGTCLRPPIDGVPEGEWFCPDCSTQDGCPAPAGVIVPQTNRKRRAEATDDVEGQGKKAKQ